MNEKTLISSKPSYGLKRIFSKLCVNLSRSPLFPTGIRIRILMAAGIRIGRGCFVGNGVYFDEIRPDLIEIGTKTTITSGCRIISHFYNPYEDRYYVGKVVIGSKVFIGMNTLIVNSVRIGDGSVIGAGSVVTKDIPEREIWSGNPAKFIKPMIEA